MSSSRRLARSQPRATSPSSRVAKNGNGTRTPLRVDDVSVTVGVGGRCRGVAGFRQSHSEALHAQALAAIGVEATTSARIVTYQDVEVVALLAADLPMARALVHRRLGPLAARDRATADLRATLLAHLQTDRSLIRAAEQLHVARNTRPLPSSLRRISPR